MQNNPPQAVRRLDYERKPRAATAAAATGLVFWPILLAGYVIGGRNFSYFGVAPLFIGEAYLGLSVLRNTGRWMDRFVSGIFKLELMPVAIALQLGWMLLEGFRCLFDGRNPIEIFRTAAFQYYSLYLLIGVALGSHTTLRRLVKFWKITSIIFLIWYAACTAVPSLGESKFGFEPFVFPLTPVMLIALWPYLRDWSLRHLVVALTMAPTLLGAGRGRGGFLGLAIGIGAIAFSSKQRLIKLGVPLGCTIVILFLINPFLPGNEQWAVAADPVTHIAGLLATNRPELAAKMMRSRGHLDQAEAIGVNQGTAQWRKQIWTAALNSLNTGTLKLLGQGGGASMQGMVADGQDIHTPHNFAIFCIYYVGYGGLAVTAVLLLSIVMTGRTMHQAPLRDALRGNFWSTLPVALTGNCLESPGGAIPFYLLCGLLIGVDRKISSDARAAMQTRRQQNRSDKIDQSEDFADGAQLLSGSSRRRVAPARRGIRTSEKSPA